MRGFFSFEGRLSRAAWRRRQIIEASIVGAGIFGAIVLVMNDAPRPVALLPLVLVPVGLLAMLSGWTRRLHDVGLHMRHVIFGGLLWFLLLLGPIVLLLLIKEPPLWLVWAVAIWIVGFLLFSSFQQFRLGVGGEWRLGDPGPNEFGPPP